jgi:ABC-2 type transport system permease protein
MFLVRMMIDGAGPDSGYAWLRWLVPLEWGLLIRPWSGERWWVAVLPVGLFVVLSALALRLESARDHGAGLRAVPSRSGNRRPGLLAGPFGLAWRLQRNGLIGWTIGLLVGAVGTGSIVSQTGDSLAKNPQVAAMLTKMGGSRDFEISIYVAMLGILAGIAGAMAAVLLGHLRREETHGHLEPMLATAVSRWRAAASHLVWALVAPVVLMIGVGALLPMAQVRAGGDGAMIGQYARSAAALAPGMLLICGIAMILLGWLPRLFNLVWVVIGWSLFTTWFAALVDLPGWAVKLQPWGYLSFLPRDTMDWTPFLIETAIAAVLVMLGLVGFRSRDIPA